MAVECTGGGVFFVEVDANVTLAEFGDIQPSIPGFDELLHNILSPQNVINSPLLLIQRFFFIIANFFCKSAAFELGLLWVRAGAEAAVRRSEESCRAEK
ncbi:hypothetical protein SUGI_0915470 [Cryptomeria japonica]|nr:hypothetical protein SUGI_0915470 [Cryptomeria japonica]